MTTQDKITEFSKNMMNFLNEKNKRYGDSVLHPLKIFGKHSEDFISVPEIVNLLHRVDEKLKRVMNSSSLNDNDVVDIIGYLIILMISQDKFSDNFFKKFLD